MKKSTIRLNPIWIGLGVLLTAGILLSSCTVYTTSVKPFTEAQFLDETDSVIYIFRDKHSERKRKGVKVKVGDDELGELFTYGYYEVHVPAGRHTVKAYMGATIQALNIETEANKYYYFGISGKVFTQFASKLEIKLITRKLEKNGKLEMVYPVEAAEALGEEVSVEETEAES